MIEDLNMTLEYKEHDMSLIEGLSPLMGYFEPDGEFIDFSTLLDVPTHDGDATIPPVYEFLNSKDTTKPCLSFTVLLSVKKIKSMNFSIFLY